MKNQNKKESVRKMIIKNIIFEVQDYKNKNAGAFLSYEINKVVEIKR